MSLEPFTVTAGSAIPRRPRQYAAAIIALETKAERQAALAQVPEELQALTRLHVEIAWNHPKGNING